MNYATEKIAEALKKAREQKGLSQRALSARAGVPQSHISKIENNAVDLRLSSLTAIANALDLELALVPRKAIPAVKSITRSVGAQQSFDPTITKEFHKIEKALKSFKVPPIKLEGLDRLQRSFREISQYQSLIKDADLLRNIRSALENIESAADNEAIKRAADQMNALRNSLAHAQSTVDHERPMRPAYRLEGSEND